MGFWRKLFKNIENVSELPVSDRKKLDKIREHPTEENENAGLISLSENPVCPRIHILMHVARKRSFDTRQHIFHLSA